MLPVQTFQYEGGTVSFPFCRVMKNGSFARKHRWQSMYFHAYRIKYAHGFVQPQAQMFLTKIRLFPRIDELHASCHILHNLIYVAYEIYHYHPLSSAILNTTDYLSLLITNHFPSLITSTLSSIIFKAD